VANARRKSADVATITVRVRVQPRSSRSEIQGFINGLLRIRTTAAPADGKANADVARQLAKAYKVPISRVTLMRGASFREKVFRIASPASKPEFPLLD